MYYPPLKKKNAQQIVTSNFGGINRAEKISDGQFARAMNLSTREYPMICPRKPRGHVGTLSNPGGMIAKDQLCWVDGSQVYYDGAAVAGITLSTAAADWPKRMVGMGAYVVIFPDKVYFNTVDPTDCGSLEDTYTSSGSVTYTICRMDGTDYPSIVASDTEPEDPQNGDYWIDTSGDEHRLMVYSYTYGTWTQIYSVYTRINATGIGSHFKEGDTVEISGIAANSTIPTGTKTKSGNKVRITDALAGNANSVVITQEPVRQGSGTASEYNERPFQSWTGVKLFVSPKGTEDDAVQRTASWASTLYGFEMNLTTGQLKVKYGHIASYSGQTLPGKWWSSRDEYSPGKTPSTGAEVVYETTQSITSQTGLTVPLQRGVNVIWANAGETSITYGYYDTAYEKAIGQLDGMNGSQYIYAAGDNWIVILGLLDRSMTQGNGAVSMERKCPDMEFVIENDNRLWGCHYGEDADGNMINEIYACKLGDFKNWRVYQGISTDSYAVSLGSDGPFTGAIAYGGMPLFFKETCVHKIYGNQPKNYQVMTTQMRGVQRGSEKSLVIVDGTLLYMSPTGVETYDGSLPTAIGMMLGDVERGQGVAGALDSRYYMACVEGNENHLYVYDLRQNIWLEEDAPAALAFVPFGSDLYMLDGETGEIITMTGTEGEPEGQVNWLAETGLQGWEQVNQKYVTRYNIRAKLPAGTMLKCSLQYDSEGRWWEKLHRENYSGSTRTLLMPVYPKRCDHIRMRIEGRGEIKIFSIARLMTNGGDGQRG